MACLSITRKKDPFPTTRQHYTRLFFALANKKMKNPCICVSIYTQTHTHTHTHIYRGVGWVHNFFYLLASKLKQPQTFV